MELQRFKGLTLTRRSKSKKSLQTRIAAASCLVLLRFTPAPYSGRHCGAGPAPAHMKGSERLNLFAHALDNTRPPSAFISTSKSADIAAGFADNIYVVRPRGGIDVNQVLGPRSPFPSELEIAVSLRINPSDIRGVTLPSEGMSLLNPNWVP